MNIYIKYLHYLSPVSTVMYGELILLLLYFFSHSCIIVNKIVRVIDECVMYVLLFVLFLSLVKFVFYIFRFCLPLYGEIKICNNRKGLRFACISAT